MEKLGNTLYYNNHRLEDLLFFNYSIFSKILIYWLFSWWGHRSVVLWCLRLRPSIVHLWAHLLPTLHRLCHPALPKQEALITLQSPPGQVSFSSLLQNNVRIYAWYKLHSGPQRCLHPKTWNLWMTLSMAKRTWRLRWRILRQRKYPGLPEWALNVIISVLARGSSQEELATEGDAVTGSRDWSYAAIS